MMRTPLLGAALAVALLSGCFGGRRTPPPAPQAAPEPSLGLGAGELKAGDRIVLTVEDEEALTDTFTVTAGPAVDLPSIGVVSLAGVQRQDVTKHLTVAIGKHIKSPVVRAQTLVRVAVLGEVERAGYFALPADALVSDAINEAGGPSADAEMKKIQWTRRGKVLQQGTKFRNSIAAGRTLDEMGMEAGDEIMVPRRTDSERTVRILSLVVTIPLAILALTRM
jgi:polysaccharide export outer membrane protein